MKILEILLWESGVKENLKSGNGENLSDLKLN